jgi:type IV secretory pathway VirJ component
MSEMENLDGSNSPAKQQDASPADQPDKATPCGDAADSYSERPAPNENTTVPLLDALAVPVPVHSTPRTEVKADTRKRVAFIAVGKPKVTVTRPETTSSIATKKQRVDIIPPAPADRAFLTWKEQPTV